MKFKVGEPVKVRDDSKHMEGRYAGKRGIIKEIRRGDIYPYDVKFDDGLEVFCANELERDEQ